MLPPPLFSKLVFWTARNNQFDYFFSHDETAWLLLSLRARMEEQSVLLLLRCMKDPSIQTTYLSTVSMFHILYEKG